MPWNRHRQSFRNATSALFRTAVISKSWNSLPSSLLPCRLISRPLGSLLDPLSGLPKGNPGAIRNFWSHTALQKCITSSSSPCKETLDPIYLRQRAELFIKDFSWNIVSSNIRPNEKFLSEISFVGKFNNFANINLSFEFIALFQYPPYYLVKK